MLPSQIQFGRRPVVVVDLFAGMSTFLSGFKRQGIFPGLAVEFNFYAASMHIENFKDSSGQPVVEFVKITKEEYLIKKKHVNDKGKKDQFEEVGIINDCYVRTKPIQEYNGKEIRTMLEKKYGKDVFIIQIGGSPCQD